MRFLVILCFFFIVAPTQMHAQQSEVEVFDHFDELKHLFTTESDSTYVINFWATWCKPCVAELPYFEKLYDELSNEKVRLILISLDFKDKVDTKLIPFMKKKKLKGEVMVLADRRMNDWIGRVDDNWSGTIPATLVYNKNYYSFVEGEFNDYEELESLVKNFLKE